MFSRMKSTKSTSSGFILLELLLALFIIQVGIVGVAQIFLVGFRASINQESSLKALELLRGEMEKLESCGYKSIASIPKKVLAPGVEMTLSITGVDDDQNSTQDYKVIDGRVSWKDAEGKVRWYQLVTYRKFAF